MTSSLVGSEMCIRDSTPAARSSCRDRTMSTSSRVHWHCPSAHPGLPSPVSYTHLTLPTICSV
eukprot:9392201-Prorocentrum_lima.AAC.1